MRILLQALAVAALCVFEAAAQTAIPVGNDPRAIVVDASANRIYVANEFSDSVTVIDGASHATTTVAVGRRPQHIAVNTRTHKVYVNNGTDASISVIDAASLAVTTLPVGSTGPIVVNEATNKVYIARTGNTDEVTVLDGATNSWYTAAIFSYGPVAQALIPATQRLYVANYATGDVRVVDTTSTSAYPPSVSVGVWSKPVAIAADPDRNRVYVITEDARGPIGIIDGASNTATFLAPAGRARGAQAVAVNPATHRAYAAFDGEVVAIDGATNAMSFLAAPGGVGIAIDASRNRIYVPGATGSMAIIDGASHAVTTAGIPQGARAVAVNPATGRVYVVGPGLTVYEAGSAPPPPPSPPTSTGVNVQGLWWASPAGVESGWGINLAHQGEIVFATWFTYDTDGSGLWLVMSNGRRIGTNTYSGDLHRTTGPVFNTVPFDPARVAQARVGTLTLDFTDGNNGRMSATVNGASVSKPITRQVFASPMPACSAGGAAGAIPNYQDLWWNSPAGSESGWGINLTHQGDILFVTWFTYGPDGKGLWLVGSNVVKAGNATYSGTLFRTTGPPFNASPWNAAQVAKTPVGTVTLTFGDANTAQMSYTVSGISQTKSITRQSFASPATTCR